MATKSSNADSSKQRSKGGLKRATPKVAPQWTFPKNTLEDSIAIAKAIEDKHGGNPMKADLLAKAVGFNKSNNRRFTDLLKSANLYGLVSGSGASATASLEEIGQNVVAPGSPQDRKKALLAAFHHVDDFKKVDDFYGNKRIPEDEYFLNTLTRQFNIPRDRAEVFADVFRKNIRFLASFDIQTGLAELNEMQETIEPEGTVKTTTVRKEHRVREFLDTCFVMMPFGVGLTDTLKTSMFPLLRRPGSNPLGQMNFSAPGVLWSKSGNR